VGAVLDLASLSAGAAYAVIVALVFCESGILLGFFLPGDTVLFAAGLLSARTLSLPLLIALVLVAAVSGDAVGYATGRRAGPSVFEQREGRVLNPQTLERARNFYASSGPLAVVAARWIPWVRTFTPLLAGAAKMRYGRFLAANVVGALTWGAGLLVLGRLAASTPGIKSAAGYVAAVVVALSFVGGYVQYRRSRRSRFGRGRSSRHAAPEPRQPAGR